MLLRLCVMTRLLHIARTVIYDPKPSLLLHPLQLPTTSGEYQNKEVRQKL